MKKTCRKKNDKSLLSSGTPGGKLEEMIDGLTTVNYIYDVIHYKGEDYND